MKKKKINRRWLLNSLGVLIIIIAIALLALTLLMQIQEFAIRYEEFLLYLAEFEQRVASLPNKGLVIIAILFIYLLKVVVPLPISAVCVIAGMVFPTQFAVAINIGGFILLATIKFLWGKHLGGGFVHKFLMKNANVEDILSHEGKGKDMMLVSFRLVPCFPINTISQLYGAMDYDYYRYILFSVIGFMPKIVSYSMVGRHVYNPFSLSFMLPLVIIFMISGLAMLGINALIDFFNEKGKVKNTEKKKAEG